MDKTRRSTPTRQPPPPEASRPRCDEQIQSTPLQRKQSDDDGGSREGERERERKSERPRKLLIFALVVIRLMGKASCVCVRVCRVCPSVRQGASWRRSNSSTETRVRGGGAPSAAAPTAVIAAAAVPCV